MGTAKNLALAGTRRMHVDLGLGRVEVRATETDRILLREMARALRDEPVPASDLRRHLWRLLGKHPKPSRKAALMSTSLEGIDLDRSPDPGRKVEPFRVPDGE
jgi:hypothetical protein